MSQTVYENVANDFYWFPELISNLSPLIALIGAIFLFYRQQAYERAEKRRDGRQQVYLAFLSHMNVLWNEIASGPSARNLGQHSVAFGKNALEVRLVAPTDVFENAHKLKLLYNELALMVTNMTVEEWLDYNSEARTEFNQYLPRLNQAEEDFLSSIKFDLDG